MALMYVANGRDQTKVKPGEEATAGQMTAQWPKLLDVNYGESYSCWGTQTSLSPSPCSLVEMQIMTRVEMRRNTHQKKALAKIIDS